MFKFIKFLNDTRKANVYLKIVAEVALVNILRDVDIYNLPDAGKILASFVDFLNSFSNAFEKGEEIK